MANRTLTRSHRSADATSCLSPTVLPAVPGRPCWAVEQPARCCRWGTFCYRWGLSAPPRGMPVAGTTAPILARPSRFAGRLGVLVSRQDLRGATTHRLSRGLLRRLSRRARPGRSATQEPELAARLDPLEGARRLAKYLRTLTLRGSVASPGLREVRLQNREHEDLAALCLEAAAMARVPVAGTTWGPGV